MNSQIIAGIVVGALIIGGGSFYGGMQYENSMRASQRGQFAAGQGLGRTGGTAGRFAGGTGNFVAGTILSSDASGITLQLGGQGASSTNNGQTGSKIILVNSSTEIGKFVSGSKSDLSAGQSVMVQGTQNSDGSISATNIQIRPAGQAGFGGRGAAN
jgi:hypothetical protein